MGAAAVLVNCLPSDKIDGVAPWLRRFTSLPIGAYPNMGTYLRYEWDWSSCPTPEQFLNSARAWVDEGMQIIGGCCGARPAHIKALVDGLRLAVVD
jgi:homocysteine S-methyltransferase